MLNKKTLLGLVFVLILPYVMATTSTTNTFIGGTSDVNSTMTTEINNISQYFYVPRYSIINYANMTIRGYNTYTLVRDPSTYRDDGGVNCNGDPAYLFDRNTSTCTGHVFQNNCNYWFNFTQPQFNNTEAVLRLWVNESGYSTPTLVNITVNNSNISQGCGAGFENISFRVRLSDNNVTVFCKNSTGGAGIEITSYDADSICQAEINFTNVINDPHIYLGNFSKPALWNYTGFYNTSELVTFTSQLQSLISPCDCTLCSYDSVDICKMSLTANITTPLIDNVSYRLGYGIGGSISYTLTNSTLNITILDLDSLQKVTVPLIVETISALYNSENSEDDGELIQDIPFPSTGDHNVTIRIYHENGTDYSIIQREIILTQGLNYTLVAYITNTSDITTTNTVTFIVEDISTGNRLEGAVIRIQKQNPVDGTFYNITDLTTNPNGEATTILQTDSAFYNFLVDYLGERVFTSSFPVPITSSDDTIFLPVNLGGDFTGCYNEFFDIDVDMNFTKYTNFSGLFRSTFDSNLVHDICLNVTIENITGSYPYEYTCLSDQTDGTLDSSLITVTNITTFLGMLSVDFNDGCGSHNIMGVQVRLGDKYQGTLGGEGLFILFAVIIFAGLGFIANPLVGIIIGIFGVVGVYMMGVTDLTLKALMLIISIMLFSAITIARRKS